jgi:AraC family transcriptional activator of pobA
MVLKFEEIQENTKFQLADFNCPDQNERMNKESMYRIVWVQKGTSTFLVDTIPVDVKENQMIFFTPHNIVEIVSKNHELMSFSFNREFYCINDHDHEVSCHGHLFYGSSEAPIITLCEKDQLSFTRLMDVFQEEFENTDNIQGEMLRILLKRMLIKSSRLIIDLMTNPDIPQSQLDIIRKFNVLVEQNFKAKHQVKDYADLLFRSPKTLSNLFKQYNNDSPLQVINQRIVLEAKRQLVHSIKTIDELSYELGYKDAAHFSKFFKKQIGISPNAFRKQL